MDNETETQTQTNEATDSSGQEQPNVNSGTGVPSILEQIRTEREAADKTLESIRQERKSWDNDRAEEALGGRSTAGAEPQPKDEISDEEYAKKALAGNL